MQLSGMGTGMLLISRDVQHATMHGIGPHNKNCRNVNSAEMVKLWPKETRTLKSEHKFSLSLRSSHFYPQGNMQIMSFLFKFL